ncbi:hypothetical protein H0H81_011986 [Sphagnurus paluster]|uniref:Wings apart-like protein C-terminal domain-containing protein n=1 Tax=Sphagnurus paluster TaxID=117069 RepID=A0A9P7GPH3_9AGAR|nr:hypothetical protein H0H81_011986 [Sphagnurus paluster]
MNSTYNARTYGRKSSAKRKRPAESEPRKRRKGSEERQGSTDVEDASPSTPQRPTSKAKDLSRIFDSHRPTGSSQDTPMKLASRMLGRSKTDSSIDSGNATPAHRTPSLPALFHSPPHTQETRPPPIPVPNNTRTYAGKSRSFLVSIPTAGLDPLAGDLDEDEYSTRESYASLRSRWGVDNSEDDPYPLPSPTRSGNSSPSGTPTKPRGKSKQEPQPRPQKLPNGMMNPLKSITELRNKGESRRFLDEVGYLFEGMHSGVGIGLRRASALEITTKLCDAEFARKAKAADFLSRAWDVFADAGAGRGEDKILDTLLAFFVALVSRDPAALHDLAHSPPGSPASPASKSKSREFPCSFVDTLFALLDVPVDALALISSASSEKDAKEKTKHEAELKRLGIGKKDRVTFQVIYDTILNKSSLFPAHTPLSTSLLLTHALAVLPSALLAPTHLPVLLRSLQRTIAPLAPTAPLTWPDAVRTLPYASAAAHIRLLEAWVLGQWAEDAERSGVVKDKKGKRKGTESEQVLEDAVDAWLAEGLVALGVCGELGVDGPDVDAKVDQNAARTCLDTVLRVLVGLTHADHLRARKIADAEGALPFVLRIVCARRPGPASSQAKQKELLDSRSDDEDMGDDTAEGSACSLDTLCLGLGLLTNLVQGIEGMQDTLRDTRLDPTCTLRKRACIRRCTCTRAISALDILVQLYTRYQPASDAAHSHSPAQADDDAVDPADALFLRGHLAVLFGLLIRGCEANQEHILDALGGARALRALVEQAREFVAFYAALGEGAGVSASASGVGGTEDGQVAQDVVCFLEGLVDGRLGN